MQLLIPTPGDWATAIRWQLRPCSLPAPCLSGGNPLLWMGLNSHPEKSQLLHSSSEGLGTQGCCTGSWEQPGMCRWWKVMKGKALGPKDRSGDCTGVEWPGQQAGTRRGTDKEWPIWSSILSSPNDHEAQEIAFQNTMRMWWTHFILQLSGQHGQSSVCKSSNKVPAAALGLVFSVMSMESKNKKQIARPEFDETEEWKSWLKHFPNATQRNRWRKKWNNSSLLLCTYCNTQH